MLSKYRYSIETPRVFYIAIGLFFVIIQSISKTGRASDVEAINDKIRSLGAGPQTAAKRATLQIKLGELFQKKSEPEHAEQAFREALSALAQVGDDSGYQKLCNKLCRSSKGWPKARAKQYCLLSGYIAELDRIEKSISQISARHDPPLEENADLLDLSAQLGELSKKLRSQENPFLEAKSLSLEAMLAKIAGYSDEASKKLEQAARLCTNGVCTKMAVDCLKQAVQIASQRGDFKRAYEFLVKAAWEKTEGLPDEERRYARDSELDKACERMGAGQIVCARIELEQLGRALLRDFSRQSFSGSLPKESIESVHRQALVLLQICLEQQLRMGNISSGDNFEVFWAITNEGKTDRFKLSPADAPEQLRTCLQKAVTAFRYPRYTGQRQTVTVPLSVSSAGFLR